MLVAGTWVAERVQGPTFRNTARFVAAFAAAALYLKLLVLLHPPMPVGDAVFQAHRFEWVLSGRYYFTSIAPGGYEFPYAIGLYVVARSPSRCSATACRSSSTCCAWSWRCRTRWPVCCST